MILKIVSPKKLAKMAFYAQTTACFGRNLIITLVFEKNVHFFEKKLAKIAKKIAIIISTPWIRVCLREARIWCCATQNLVGQQKT
jgi:hypothetical protein